MKKLLAILLAVVLTLTMSVVVFAAGEITNDKKTADGNVNVGVKTNGGDDGIPDPNPKDVDPDGDDAVYSVDIDGVSITFTYEFGDYNATEHTYGTGSWDKTSANITVTNHSNTSITVTPSWKNLDGASNGLKNGVQATLGAALDLASAALNQVKTEGTISVSIDETNKPTTTAAYELDGITLTVAGKK